jgi:spermidine synthase
MIRVFAAYALSGFVALGYQVVWFRLFPDWFGSTSLSFALVTCNFIGGLGVGSLASRRVTQWIARVTGVAEGLRLYGLVELLVAVAAALTVLAGLLPAHAWGDFPYHLRAGIWVQNPGYRFGQLAVAVVCVFTPCFWMGTTFPLLSRVLRDAPAGERLPAALYGWNTLGACTGVLACQFLLLPSIGHTSTFWLMLGLNVAIAGFFLITGRGSLHFPSLTLSTARSPHLTSATPGVVQSPQSPSPALSAAPEDQAGAAAPTNLAALLLTCAVLSGLLAGALEGDLFKRINLVVSNSPGALGPAISFWAILGIFLASALVWRARRLRLLHIKIAYLCAALYFYAAWRLMYPVLLYRLNARSEAIDALGMINNFPDSAAELFLFVGGCVFVPYLLISLLLPYVCNQAQMRGMHLGLAYGLNTLAFCVGLMAFTLLAPEVNIFYSLKLLWVLLGCGVALLLVLSEGRRVRWWQPAAAAAALLAGCMLTPSGFDAGYLLPGSIQSRDPVSSLKSNGTDTSYVIRAPEGAYLFFGNTSMSGTVTPSQVYMRLMAHVPLLLQADPQSALVICFGVGNTASAIATHDSIRHLDIVDLNRNVFETAWEFATTNDEVYRDPRVRLINDDGRSFLRLSRNTYDLITSEPPPPMQAGVYRLYSQEYYRDVLAHLTPGGMMTQWLPVYQMPSKAAAEAIAAFVQVFPHTLLYSGISQELILLGSREPIDIDRLRRNFPASGRERADLAAIFVRTPASLGARIVRTDATLRRDYLRSPAISDERNDLEQMFLRPPAAAVTYDRRGVMEWLSAQAPQMAAAVEELRNRRGK